MIETIEKVGIAILALVLLYMLCLVIQGDNCQQLRRHGFRYTIEGGFLSTWDYVHFSSRKTGVGPRIGGGPLKVTCQDMTGDAVKEYLVSHKRDKRESVIIQVDLVEGTYHIYAAGGLKVSYPPEGYYADF